MILMSERIKYLTSLEVVREDKVQLIYLMLYNDIIISDIKSKRTNNDFGAKLNQENRFTIEW